MKKKDLIYLVVSAVIFVAVGIVGYSQLNAGKGGTSTSGKHTATVEVITPITSDFNATAQQQLQDPTKARDFYSPIDLHSGLNNPQPFNPI